MALGVLSLKSSPQVHLDGRQSPNPSRTNSPYSSPAMALVQELVRRPRTRHPLGLKGVIWKTLSTSLLDYNFLFLLIPHFREVEARQHGLGGTVVKILSTGSSRRTTVTKPIADKLPILKPGTGISAGIGAKTKNTPPFRPKRRDLEDIEYVSP